MVACKSWTRVGSAFDAAPGDERGVQQAALFQVLSQQRARMKCWLDSGVLAKRKRSRRRSFFGYRLICLFDARLVKQWFGRVSFFKQVRVRSRSLKTNRGGSGAVNQHPIRFDMKIAARLPFPFQRVVAKLAGKRYSCQQQFDHGAQFAHIGIARRTHQMPNCLNSPDRLETGNTSSPLALLRRVSAVNALGVSFSAM